MAAKINTKISDNDKLLTWLADRPEITPQRLCKEAGIPRMVLYDLKRGIDVPPKHWEKLLQRLRLLGWAD